jgi:hypothetical protein
VEMRFAAAVLGLIALLPDVPVFAHHSFAAQYDAKEPITLTGTITKVEIVNPHAWIYVDVKNAHGKAENWACEAGAPNAMMRRGWKRDSLKVGDVVHVDGYRAKNGATTLKVRSVTFPNGRTVFAGSSDNGAPPTPQAPQK